MMDSLEFLPKVMSMICGNNSKQMSAILKPLFQYIKETIDLDETMKVIDDLCNDMHQLLRVAQYNLTGELNGEEMDKPEEPNLIHQRGIDESRAVIKRGRDMWRKLDKLKEEMEKNENDK